LPYFLRISFCSLQHILEQNMQVHMDVYHVQIRWNYVFICNLDKIDKCEDYKTNYLMPMYSHIYVIFVQPKIELIFSTNSYTFTKIMSMYPSKTNTFLKLLYLDYIF
jgi:hypothetical protein